MQPRIRHLRRLPVAGLSTATLLASLALAPAASAHGGIEVGDYVLVIGWRNEPALVGEPNGVELLVSNHHDESPVNTGVALEVVVSTGGQSSDALQVTPQFEVGEFGTPGDYGADLIPTAPGDYTFHLTGRIKDTDVDVEMTSGDETFSQVLGSSDLEFPVKQPTLTEVGTRLDRIDDRIAALQSADPGAHAVEVAQDASETAAAATAAASQAMLIGTLVGGAGVLVAVIALFVAMRAGRRSAGAA